jgi:lactoylglutathione lyase
MNRIVHLALKVEDLERTTEFYQKVFGFVEMNTERVRDHTSRHLSDGVLDIALIKYDAGAGAGASKNTGHWPTNSER